MAVIGVAVEASKSPSSGAMIQLRCPAELRPLLAKVAAENLTTVSGYVRGALVEKLRREGHLQKGRRK